MSANLANAEVPLPRHSVLIVALILFAVFCNLIYPGEVFPQSKFLLFLVSALACVTVILDQRDPRQSVYLLSMAGGTFLPLFFLLPSVFLSVNFSRSQEVWFLFFSYGCLYFSLGTIRVNNSARLACVLFVSFSALVVVLQALHQSVFGLKILRDEVAQLRAAEASFQAALLSRIDSGRVFAHFSLPNTLAGFVAMVLPLNLFLIFLTFNGSRSLPVNKWVNRFVHSPVARIVLCAQLVISLVVLFLTQSFGGWLSCIGSLTVGGFVWLKQRNIRWRTMAAAIAVMITAAMGGLGWITLQRGFALWDLSATENPIALRWINYVTAWNIFQDFPLTGAGLGNYGTLNPRYVMSERFATQYAHSTPLQLLSECGVLIFVFLFAVASILLRRRHRVVSSEPAANWRRLLRISLLTGILAWFIHNSLDIDLYFPSLGALGIVLCGLYAQRDSEPVSLKIFTPRKRSMSFLRGGALALLLVVFAAGAKFYLSRTFAELAAELALSSDFEPAKRYARWAVNLNPSDAELMVIQSKIEVTAVKPTSDEDRLRSLRTLRRAFERASKLDPFNPGYHLELSRIYSGLGEEDLAEKARRRAQYNVRARRDSVLETELSPSGSITKSVAED